MSVGSIGATLVETRAVRTLNYTFRMLTNDVKTMKRLREISRFECDVRVLRNGFCKHLSPLPVMFQSLIDLR